MWLWASCLISLRLSTKWASPLPCLSYRMVLGLVWNGHCLILEKNRTFFFSYQCFAIYFQTYTTCVHNISDNLGKQMTSICILYNKSVMSFESRWSLSVSFSISLCLSLTHTHNLEINFLMFKWNISYFKKIEGWPLLSTFLRARYSVSVW